MGAQSTIPGKTGRTPIKKRATSNAAVLSEAYADPNPVLFFARNENRSERPDNSAYLRKVFQR